MNKINSYTGPSISKLVIPLLIVLVCAPIPALAAMYTPSLDRADRFNVQNDPDAPFIFLVGSGRISASGQFAEIRSQKVFGFNRNNGIGEYRKSGRSASRQRDSLFARTIIVNQGISLETPVEPLCGSANAKDCVSSFVGKNFADAQTAVPVPAALWLFASGLLGVIGIARRRTTAAA